LKDSPNSSKNWVTVFDLPRLTSEEERLTRASESEEVWSDQKRMSAIMKDLTLLREKLGKYRSLEARVSDAVVLHDLSLEADDAESQAEALAEAAKLEPLIDAAMLEASFTEKHDAAPAILAIHPGAGGTESCDWAAMLFRMYTRWAEKSGFKCEMFDRIDGDEAGIKSVTFMLTGPYAYGKLSGERGVHRLVRISPFDSNARRHTSFVSGEVMPEVEEDVEVVINEEDLKIDTYRSSGAGGQHVNVTDSAVRITHLPSGLVVTCQNERSQIKNRSSAMKILRARLYERMLEEREKELDKIRGVKKEIAWGSQIRSYVLQPYTMVKDHRTGCEVGNAAGVLDGDIDPFLNAYLKWSLAGGVKA
jgi:peptide chain release factor 2